MKKPVLPPSVLQQMPRLVTGLALAIVLTACLVLGGAYLAMALALVSVLALYEFFQLFWPGKTRIPTKIFGLFMALALFCPVGGGAAAAVIPVLVFAWAAIAFLFEYSGSENPVSGVNPAGNASLSSQAPLVLGFLYVPVIVHLALSLTLKEQFLVVLAAIASDTAAYYAGCAFGRHKIWPRVSPKKSWEGSIAGFIATIAVTVCIACIPFGDGPLHGGGVLMWIVIGALLNIAAQFGDFFESALKRVSGVKDSSALLPGHGGILDRIDSILFALAAYSAIMLLRAHIELLAA